MSDSWDSNPVLRQLPPSEEAVQQLVADAEAEGYRRGKMIGAVFGILGTLAFLVFLTLSSCAASTATRPVDPCLYADTIHFTFEGRQYTAILHGRRRNCGR